MDQKLPLYKWYVPLLNNTDYSEVRATIEVFVDIHVPFDRRAQPQPCRGVSESR